MWGELLGVAINEGMTCANDDADVTMSCPVVTRSQKVVEPLPNFADDLFQGGEKGPRKSRRQRRLEKYSNGGAFEKLDTQGLEVEWEVPHDIAKLQREDVSPVREGRS